MGLPEREKQNKCYGWAGGDRNRRIMWGREEEMGLRNGMWGYTPGIEGHLWNAV